MSSDLRSGLRVISIIGLSVGAITIGAQQLGWLQSLELRLYDRLTRIRMDDRLDDRLLVVEITEEDIRNMGRATPTDDLLAEAIVNLQRHEPLVIGLDLYRDVPQGDGHERLLPLLQEDEIIVIKNLGLGDIGGVPAPEGVPEERVGFNDLVIDRDGVVRRNLLFGNSSYSFSLRLALYYLRAIEEIEPQSSEMNPDYMQLGEAVFIPLRYDSGGYQTADDRGYQILLRFHASQSVAPRATFSEVLNNQVNPELIRDRIILIGNVAPSNKDLFLTPFSPHEGTESPSAEESPESPSAEESPESSSTEENLRPPPIGDESAEHKMAGVDIHAQSVVQILNAALGKERLFWFWPNPVEWLWILGWAFGAGAMAWWQRRPLTLVLGSGLVLVMLTGSTYVIFTQSGWVPLAAPAIAALLSTGSVIAYQAQQAQQQQQMVMTLLGQNTSPEVAEALWRNRDRLLQSGKLPGQQLTATMLFTDIRGFSTISEQMSPELLLGWLNEYLEAMTQEICDYHGIVNKFTGDGLLAVFGVPMPRISEAEIARDACNAVACALAMGDRLQQLNGEWQAQGFKPIQMRVGIFTGPIVAGSLGGKQRMEYGVIGDSVNIASRLESCAKERQVGICRVLIAEETLQYIIDDFQVEPWGRMELRGRHQPVQVYRVIASLHSASSGNPPDENSTPLKSEFSLEQNINFLNLLEE
jgi:CHASE2 domain-containing sensor protein